MSDNDSFSEVTHSSLGERLGQSFKGIASGLILFALGTCLMYWNEGRAVRTGDAIAEAQQATEILPSIDRVDPAMNGKLVHASGKAVTTDELTDTTFGIKAIAIKLRHKVEYYQWREERRSEKRKKLGGGEETVTTYTYNMAWVPNPVDSSAFHRREGHENVTRVQVQDEEWYAPHVTFGAYRLPDFLIRSIGGEKALPVNLTGTERAELQRVFFSRDPREPARDSNAQLQNLAGELGSAVAEAAVGPNSMIHNQGNFLYIGRRPNAPRVGDVRISFFEVPPAEISLIAKVQNDTFVPFLASNGKTFSRLSMGVKDMGLMFEDARSDNDIMTWVLRIVGMLLCIGGLRAVFAPLAVVADVLPLLGDIVGAGTGFAAALLGFAWSCLIIALAWIRFRPLLGIPLLLTTAACVIFAFIRGRSKKKTTPAAAN